jgi:hypothetical protein
MWEGSEDSPYVGEDVPDSLAMWAIMICLVNCVVVCFCDARGVDRRGAKD